MQRSARSWTRELDIQLIEAAIIAKRKSRVPTRVDLGKNGPKFYYDNAGDQLRLLPSDWKARFNHLLDLYRGDKTTVQLSKMLAAAKDGRLYREKTRGEAMESSDSADSVVPEELFDEPADPPRGTKKRDQIRHHGEDDADESEDCTLNFSSHSNTRSPSVSFM